MNNYTLHKLPEGFIITSDEEIKDDDFGLIEDGGIYKFSKHPLKIKKNLRVIAQQNQIDFSELSEEEQKEIGWFDVEKLAEDFKIQETAEYWIYNQLSEGKKKDNEYCIEQCVDFWKYGFQKAQELLSDRRFTLEDMLNCFNAAREMSYKRPQWQNFSHYHEKILSQSKSWNVKLEIDYIGSNNDGSDIKELKLTNDKVKITKIL